MKILLCLLAVVAGSARSLAQESAERELFRTLDRFYRWGDRVLRFTCRVHGRWLDHAGDTPRQGQFWGELEYRGNAFTGPRPGAAVAPSSPGPGSRGAPPPFTFRPARSLGLERDPDAVRDDLAALIEQAGLLPTGFPLPPGAVTRGNGRRDREAAGAGPRPADFLMRDAEPPAAAPVRFWVDRGRVTAFTVPQGAGADAIRFRIRSTWIPGDRYLLTGLLGDRGKEKDLPRVDYQYSRHAGSYFPRTITETRRTERLSLAFYGYDIELAP